MLSYLYIEREWNGLLSTGIFKDRLFRSKVIAMKLPTSITAGLAISASLLLFQYAVAQQPPAENSRRTGTICVLPNSSEPPMRFSPGGQYNPDTLTVRIDKREPISWPHKELVRIEGLTLYERHLVVLTSDGKRIHSFRFKFDDADDARLCMSYDGYQGVQLMSRKNALWCKCK